MKTNKEHLVIQSVQGRVHHPTMRGAGYRVGFDGWARIPMVTAVLPIITRLVIAAWELPVIILNRGSA